MERKSNSGLAASGRFGEVCIRDNERFALLRLMHYKHAQGM
jgi:hypothetical protein